MKRLMAMGFFLFLTFGGLALLSVFESANKGIVNNSDNQIYCKTAQTLSTKNTREIILPENNTQIIDGQTVVVYSIVANNSKQAEEGSEFSFTVTMGINYRGGEPSISGATPSAKTWDAATGVLIYTFIVPSGSADAITIGITEVPNNHTITIPTSSEWEITYVNSSESGTYPFGDLFSFKIALKNDGSYTNCIPDISVAGKTLIGTQNELVWTYSFYVTQNSTVSINVEKDKYEINLPSQLPTDITSIFANSDTNAEYGSDFTFTVRYEKLFNQARSEIRINGGDPLAGISGNGGFKYTFKVGTKNDITITPKINSYTVATPSHSGIKTITTITPNIDGKYEYGQSFVFEIKYQNGVNHYNVTVTHNGSTVSGIETGENTKIYRYSYIVAETNTIEIQIKFNMTQNFDPDAVTFNSASSTLINYGDNYNFSISIDAKHNKNYSVKILRGLVEEDITAKLNNFSYTITNIETDIEIIVTTKINEYSVTAVSSGKGTVFIEDSVTTVTHGGNITLLFVSSDDNKYVISGLKIENTNTNESQSIIINANADTHTIYDITYDMKITVTYVLSTLPNVKITMTTPELGFKFGPVKDISVKDGGSFTFTVTLDLEYSKSIPYIEISGISYALYQDKSTFSVPSPAPRYNPTTRTYTYTIFNITKDGFNGTVEITVGNIQKNKYTVTFTSNDRVQGFESILPISNIEHGDNTRTFKVTRLASHNQNDLTAKIGTTELSLKSKDGDEFEFYLPAITDDFTVIIESPINTYTLTIKPQDKIDGYTTKLQKISNITYGATNVTFIITLRSSHGKTSPKMEINETSFKAARLGDSDQYEFTIPFAIIEDNTIYIVTKLNEYTITVQAANHDSAQGFVAISPFNVSHGEDNAKFTIKRNASHNASNLIATVNGVALNFTRNEKTDEFTFTLPFVDEDFTVFITSTINRYKTTLTPHGDGYDIIDIMGSINNVAHDSTFIFTVRVHESHDPNTELVSGQATPTPKKGTKDFTYTLTITSSITIAINVKIKSFVLIAINNANFDYQTGIFENNKTNVDYGKSLEFSIKLKSTVNRSVPVFKTSDNSIWNYTKRDLANGIYTFKITNVTRNLEISILDSSLNYNDVTPTATLSFYANGGKFQDNSNSIIYENTIGTKLSLADIEKPSLFGYTFVGWVDENDTIITGDIIYNITKNFYAKWAVRNYTLTIFDSNKVKLETGEEVKITANADNFNTFNVEMTQLNIWVADQVDYIVGWYVWSNKAFIPTNETTEQSWRENSVIVRRNNAINLTEIITQEFESNYYINGKFYFMPIYESTETKYGIEFTVITEGNSTDALNNIVVWDFDAEMEIPAATFNSIANLTNIGIRVISNPGFNVEFTVDDIRIDNSELVNGYLRLQLTSTTHITIKFVPISYDIIFIEPSVKNGSVEIASTQFHMYSTLVITFNPKMGNRFKNITINEIPIAELTGISNLQMSFNNKTFTIQITQEWLDWARQSNIAWVDANGKLTLNVNADTEFTGIFLASVLSSGGFAFVLLVLTCLLIISSKNRKSDSKKLLEKEKQNIMHDVFDIKVQKLGEYEQ